MADPTRVLIVTPLKGDISRSYSSTLTTILTHEIPGFYFGHEYIAGNCVMGARDWGAKHTMEGNWDGILFWDADLNPSPADFVRLLSHRKDFVCGAYCKREVETNWHFFPVNPDPNIPIPDDGLWQMNQAAIGFSFIRKEVFAKIRGRHPERAYFNQEQGTAKTQLQQFFPWQIVGPNSDLGKLERIKTLLDQRRGHADNHFELLQEIDGIVLDTDYSKNYMQGEDYGFCRLAREVDVEIWLDTKLVVPHRGECDFPIAHEDVVRMTAEPWRQDFWAQLKAERAKGAA